MNTATDSSPAARQARAARQQAVVAALQAVLPAHAILYTPEDTTPYECDGLTAYRERPLVVTLPETDEQVQAVLKTCHGLDVPVVARGAGTGLSGGAMPHAMGVTMSLARFNRILDLNPESRTAFTTRPIRRARSPAPSVATSPRTPAACTA